ncbi:hypothetical protein A8709_15170 [Paenibacillus pectinilyticus]|uniref:HTH araC/xylS-type domain-containing protein n=1 Tax=Paenibacillus pectinilyticus TaxID=512399 RepID=A0A1C1A4D6_9BACL|nr:AraC family transcriptional regulator [Paenibacillus pectinilyticus]OCT15419.1 hypothetical protein A8709_15170 [Paenibacillus pectinilyticus]
MSRLDKETSHQEIQGWPIVHHVGDVVVQAGYILETRTISDYELVYFPDGAGTIYELEGRAIPLASPGFIFTRPGESHRYRFAPDKPVRHLFVHFDYEALLQEARFSSLLGGEVMFAENGNMLVANLMKRILRMANEQATGWQSRLAVLLAAALEELSANASSMTGNTARAMPAPILKAIAYMEEHLAEAITIEAIASQSGWSHEHFTRMFVAAMGLTPKRMLLERRLFRAEELMMRGAGTVKQIAYWAGFGDEHHFSKMYKRIRGITATAYIAQCQNPLYRHTAELAFDSDTPYPLNRHIHVQMDIK